MAWVFISIAVGAAGFVVFIVIDYLKVSAGLKPKANMAKAEIHECENKTEAEQRATNDTKQAVSAQQKEIKELEKEHGELTKKVEEYREREKRRNPTRFQLDE